MSQNGIIPTGSSPSSISLKAPFSPSSLSWVQESCGQEMTGRINHLRAQRGRVGCVQLTEGGDRGGDLPDAQLAVGHPGQGGHHGRGPDRAPQPAALDRKSVV